MKKIKLFEEFINETWKSADRPLAQEISSIKKVNVNKRLKTLWNNSLLQAEWRKNYKNHGLVMPFQQEENFGPETDSLYYPLLDRKKLEDVKNWILTYWDIGYKDFIKQVDKSKRTDLDFDSTGFAAPSSYYDSNITIMFQNRDQKEPGSVKNLAKHLDKHNSFSMLFQHLNDRLDQLAGDCYKISTSPKEMEVICKQMGSEIRKACDNYINGLIDMNNSRTKHHAKFAKEIGHIKNKHRHVDKELIPENPEKNKLMSKHGFYWEGPSPEMWNNPITDLPHADEIAARLGIQN